MAHIVKILDGYSFLPRAEQTLLEALEHQDIEIEYQCRQGFCGCCQITLVEGDVEYHEEPIAFIPEGKILPCCCRPVADITVELPFPLTILLPKQEIQPDLATETKSDFSRIPNLSDSP